MYVSMWMYGDYVLLVLMKARRHETQTWSPRYLWVSPGGYREPDLSPVPWKSSKPPQALSHLPSSSCVVLVCASLTTAGFWLFFFISLLTNWASFLICLFSSLAHLLIDLRIDLVLFSVWSELLPYSGWCSPIGRLAGSFPIILSWQCCLLWRCL